MFLIQPPQVRQPLLGVRPLAGSPLTRGLVLAVLPGQGWVNLADSRALTVSGAQPLRATGAQGPGAYVGSGATNLLQASITLGNAYTLMAVASPVSGQTQAFMDDDDAATRAFQFRWSASDGIDFIPFDLVGNALSVSTASASVASNRAAGVCAVASITSAGSIALTTRWETITASLGATTATPAATIALLNRKVGGTQTPSQGPIYLLAAWNRTLSVPEARTLVINPWQIFNPLARRVWGAVAANADNLLGQACL